MPAKRTPGEASGKSRHVAVSSPLRRSLGVDEDGNDMVVELLPGGSMRLYEETTARKRRNSKVDAVEVDLRELYEAKQGSADVPDDDSWIDALLRKMPIADFSGDAAKVGYRAKVWLMNELQKLKYGN